MNFKKGELWELSVCSLPNSNYKNIQHTLNLGFYEKKKKI